MNTTTTTVRAKLVPDEEYASEREYFFDDDAFRPEGGDDCEIYIFGGYDHKDCYYNADAHDGEYELFIEMTTSIWDIIQAGFGWKNLDEEEIKAEILEYIREYFPDMSEDKVDEFYDIADNYDGRDYPEYLARFLTLTTGKDWDTLTKYGCVQGEMACIVYCTEEHSKDSISLAAEIWVSRATAYYISDPDEGICVTAFVPERINPFSTEAVAGYIMREYGYDNILIKYEKEL